MPCTVCRHLEDLLSAEVMQTSITSDIVSCLTSGDNTTGFAFELQWPYDVRGRNQCQRALTRGDIFGLTEIRSDSIAWCP
jgi:hypothetical protein